ncbi:MAG TPA: hypothetical protein VJH65_03390 [Candidatus Nanoarchaeia archaeon]|nr:hypothetical protein [Candidatus Nanoarchaeia archaeon]
MKNIFNKIFREKRVDLIIHPELVDWHISQGEEDNFYERAVGIREEINKIIANGKKSNDYFIVNDINFVPQKFPKPKKRQNIVISGAYKNQCCIIAYTILIEKGYKVSYNLEGCL